MKSAISVLAVSLIAFVKPANAVMDETIIADSVADFSGIQGLNDWYYGYYDGNVRLPYRPADFEQLPHFTGHEWLLRTAPGGYWTGVGGAHMHPNGLITYQAPAAEHWAVRRWISDLDAQITITGNVADMDGGHGDGIKAYIFLDDVLLWSQTINDGDLRGVDYSIVATVHDGSVIDFAVSPGLNSNDLRDLTRFTTVITPEPATILLLGLGALILLRDRLCA